MFLRFCIYISIYKTFDLDNNVGDALFFWVFNYQGELVMTQKFIEKMKNELLNQRNTILESLSGQSDDMRELVKTVESGDEADVASDAIDRTLLTALGAQDAKRLQQIDSALDRIRQNKYGHCVVCGKDIPEERLQALPYTLMCINCASAQERKNR